MRACIHRGTGEIGGNCVELEQDGYRLVLDVGRPLTAGRNEEVPLPDIPGLATGDDPHLLGVILSHGHQDHWGLMSQVHPDVPRYIGKAAADILRAAKFWGTGIDLAETGHLADRQPLVLGPFTITPYLNDHSAFDGYSLLVAAGGSRLFYTGDFRGHGRKGRLFHELLANPPADVDVLMCEGTNVHREDLGDTAEQTPTETRSRRIWRRPCEAPTASSSCWARRRTSTVWSRRTAQGCAPIVTSSSTCTEPTSRRLPGAPPFPG